jgi:hypothetical protein
MINFKLEDKAAEAMMAVLNAGSPNASFVEELNTQYIEQTQVDTIVAPEPVVVPEPVVESEPEPEPEAEVAPEAEPTQE